MSFTRTERLIGGASRHHRRDYIREPSARVHTATILRLPSGDKEKPRRFWQKAEPAVPTAHAVARREP
jgi:hypothetical protein